MYQTKFRNEKIRDNVCTIGNWETLNVSSQFNQILYKERAGEKHISENIGASYKFFRN